MSSQRPPQWGPQPAPKRSSQARRWGALLVWAAIIVMPKTPAILITVATLLALGIAIRIYLDLRRLHRWWTRRRTTPRLAVTGATGLPALRAQIAAAGGGAVLGITKNRRWRLTSPERAVLVLGPPRAGKSSGLIIPTILTWAGPVVSTSTKPDVLTATATARRQVGRVWEFDPTGHATTCDRSLRWSPVTSAGSWDGALMMARAMVTGAGVGAGTTDQTHWSKRAAALLAPLLHAAHLADHTIGDVVDWVATHNLDQAAAILAQHDAPLARRSLIGLANTEAREQSSIFSAAADALEAYTSHAALTAATDPNFNADHFVRSTDAIYIHAPAEHQALAAPLVCGLLAEIRRATYTAHAAKALPHRVLFALDEAANIAPIAELPQIASEGGGQGLALIAAFQDLSQARHRWGQLADGFLTLFGEKLILPGIADTHTLETISVALGEYDRPITSSTRNPSTGTTGMLLGGATSRTTTTHRQRVLSPGEIANTPTGHALHLTSLDWELLTLINAHRDQPWRSLTATPAPAPTPRATAATAAHGR